MTEAEFKRSLRETLPLLADLDLLRMPYWRPFRLDDEFKRVAMDLSHHYWEEFLIGLNRAAYTFLLHDLSFFQMSWSGAPEHGFGVRYAYYPNPFRYHSFEDFVAETQLDTNDPGTVELYQQHLSEQEAMDGVGPIRYEVDHHSYRPVHPPCSHIHIGRGSPVRWAVDKILTPKAFALFMVRSHYPEQWQLRGQDPVNPDGPSRFDQAYANDVDSCVEVAEDFFSAMEQAHIHLT